MKKENRDHCYNTKSRCRFIARKREMPSDTGCMVGDTREIQGGTALIWAVVYKPAVKSGTYF